MRLSRKAAQEQTRERLRRSAAAEFARSGVAGAPIERIAEAAGYSRGAFYSNYRNKPELLVDLLADRQLSEIRLWTEMFEQADDLDGCLIAVIAHNDDLVRVFERTLLNHELQLEAERNPAFGAHFRVHLDRIHAEMRKLFVTILRRNGKGPPPHLDACVVMAYQFGINLGSTTVLGNDIGAQRTAPELMAAFLNEMIRSAPPLADGEH